MILKVNPNRMELLKLKKRLALAKRGHKLLKDKQEELMKRFFSIVKAARERRRRIEEELNKVYRTALLGWMKMPKHIRDSEPYLFEGSPVLNCKEITEMNIKIPEFKIDTASRKMPFPKIQVSGEFYKAVSMMRGLFPRLVEMAQEEKKLFRMAEELERTRRRVNALEYILIPNLNDTIRFISDKLSEDERGEITRLMKIKEMLAAG